MQKLNKYRTAEIARLFGIHPSTIRLYEKSGFITPADRNPKNSYRAFTEMHIQQIKICRCIFGYPFTNSRIRNAGNDVMYTSAKKQWRNLKGVTDKYIQTIENEVATAQNTADMLQHWANPSTNKFFTVTDLRLSRKVIANHFGVTVEAVRNWERNDLIVPKTKSGKGEVIYSDDALGRICVIYMLLQSGYSMAAIQRSICMYDKGYTSLVLSALNEPIYDEIVSVGDNWLNELNKLLNAANKIHPIIDELEKL